MICGVLSCLFISSFLQVFSTAPPNKRFSIRNAGYSAQELSSLFAFPRLSVGETTVSSCVLEQVFLSRLWPIATGSEMKMSPANWKAMAIVHTITEK